MAFDPDKYLKESKPAFDPDAYLAASKKDVGKTKEGAGQAFLEHYGNTALLGYLPHAQAVAEKLMPDPSGGVDAKLKAQGVKITQDESTYLKSRDENIKRLAQQEKEHPWASGAGTAAGIAGSALLTGRFLPVGKSDTLLARMNQAAKTGAAMGAAANPGDVEGEFGADAGLQLKARGKNAAIGGLLGVATQGAVEGISKGAEKLAPWFKSEANEKAYKALGAKGKAFEKAKADGADQEVGGLLLEEGAIPILGTPKRIAKRVDKLKDQAGEKVGELVKKTGNAHVVDAQEIAIQVLDDPAIASLRKTPGMEGVAEKVEKAMETLARNGDMTLEQALTLRQGIDRSINHSKRVADMKGTEEALFKARTLIRDKMSAAIDALNDPKIPKGALKSANKRYGGLADAEEILEKKIASDAANRSVSLTDTIAATAGVAQGSPLLGVALGAANKGIRTFGNSVAARSYDRIAKVLAGTPALAEMATKNPKAFQALVDRVAEQVDSRGKFERAQEPELFKDQKLMEYFEKNPDLLNNIQDPRLRSQLEKHLKRAPSGNETAIQRRLKSKSPGR